MIATHMPLERFLPSSESSASRSSSLLSRISNPLSKRSRNVFNFSIEPDEPLKLYQPGEVVKGHIVLNVFKGFDITHLVIALHGYAKVYKHQQERHSVPEELVNGKGTKGFEYHGSGLASLFQDEQTLCGSGFLRKQVYKFGFELEFPVKSLPSALNFERGTVAYMISATVTRPTTMTPTETKCHKIHFRDRIDIKNMYTPKTRVISLEPISRRGKMKKLKTSSSASTQDTLSRGTLSRNNTHTSSHSTSIPQLVNPPLSPAPSDHTVATSTTNSTGSFHVMENSSPTRKPSPQTSDTKSGDTSLSAHTITATTELPRFGALAGDIVPIKVSVTHTKPRARGVIIATLYRQGRIDMHPVLPLAGKSKDKKEYEDIYPRSRTGLGGLYFSNGSPSSVFRKDLSQSSTMMIVNPATMTAEVRTSVKVPEDAFPTISNVPGGMISFTYHVEVVIDLTGKLGESKFLPSLTSNGPTFSIGSDNGNQITSDWANSILDTTALRRTKSVVTFELPLIVGTKDSRRVHQPQQRVNQQPQEIQQSQHQQPYDGEGQNYHDDWQGEMYDAEGYQYDGYDGYYYDEHGNPLYDEWYDYNQDYAGTATATAPISNLIPPPEEPQLVDEKARLRRQEELLMPSQPPDAGGSSRDVQNFAPTAPAFPESSDSQPIPMPPTEMRSSVPESVSRASARSTDTIVPHNLTPPPSLPDNETVPQMDDKQEMERRRLMAQASAPPTDDDTEASSSRPAASSATAPTIDEDEEYLAMALSHQHMNNDQLPQYRR